VRNLQQLWVGLGDLQWSLSGEKREELRKNYAVASNVADMLPLWPYRKTKGEKSKCR